MLKFAHRLKSTSQLVRADVPASVTRVAAQKTSYYEYEYIPN